MATSNLASAVRDMCVICLKPPTNALTLPCNDTMCSECLEFEFLRALSDTKADDPASPPQCCKMRITLEQARPYLSAEIICDYEEKHDELEERFEDKERVYCGNASCTRYIPLGRRENGVAKCENCNAETCCQCQKLAHFGDCDEDEKNDDEDEKEDQGDMPSLY